MTVGALPVRRRHVVFLSGFDPKGAGFYHGLFQRECARQSVVNRLAVDVGPRRRDADGNSAWRLTASGQGLTQCKTSYHFAAWDDIVRRHWPRSAWRLLQDMCTAYAEILVSGELPTVWKTSRKRLVGLLYPLVVLGGGGLLALLAGAGVAWALAAAGAASVMSVAAAIATFGLCTLALLRIEARLNTAWLLRIFSFALKQGRGALPELEARLDTMADHLVQRMDDAEQDELLVVGFSVGSILAVSVVARAIQRFGARHPGQPVPRISFLTLGHCIPLVGLAPQAHAFRSELALLGSSASVQWFDFSSPTDWGSFALVDPLQVCRVGPEGGERPNPRMLSPRFHTMFAPDTYRRLRRDKRRMHLQYLMAADLPADYDFFAITAGPMALASRYGTAGKVRQ